MHDFSLVTVFSAFLKPLSHHLIAFDMLSDVSIDTGRGEELGISKSLSSILEQLHVLLRSVDIWLESAFILAFFIIEVIFGLISSFLSSLFGSHVEFYAFILTWSSLTLVALIVNDFGLEGAFLEFLLF